MKSRQNQYRASFQTSAQQGFTLVELMVAMVIGLIITAGVIQIFVSSRATYSAQQGMSRSQEGGRFSVEFMAYDLRMAGYMGCNSNIGQVQNIVTPAGHGDFPVGGISGHSYSGAGGNALTDWTPTLPGDFFDDGDVAPFTDVVFSVHASDAGVRVAEQGPSTAEITIYESPDFIQTLSVDDILIVSDCLNANIFRASGFSNNPGGTINISTGVAAGANGLGNSQPQLPTVFEKGAELMKLVKNGYFVGRPDYDGDGNPDANAPLTLHRVELINGQPSKQPLVEHVETMRVLYGRDTNLDGSTSTRTADTFQTAAQVSTAIADGASPPGGGLDCPVGGGNCPDWQNVITIRIGMAIVTPENVDQAIDQNVYHIFGDRRVPEGTYDDYGNTAVGAGGYGTQDNRRRLVFATNIRIRNR